MTPATITEVDSSERALPARNAGARRATFELLLVQTLFLVSGLSALVYQVAWQRILAFHSGVGVTSVALIVGAFMAGLGIGSHLGGVLSARMGRGRALRAFGLLELGIGIFALISCPLFYDLLLRHAAGLYATPAGAGLGHFLALLVPTTLMGMSLPFLVRAMVRDAETAPRTIATLYGINVVGAALGAAATPWLLIRYFGITGAVWAGAAGNLLTALTTIALSFHPSWRETEVATAPAVASKPQVTGGGRVLALWAVLYGASGFVALALEIVWFRIADVAIKSAAFTFGSILSIYLWGLAAGSLGGARLEHRLRDPYRTFLFSICGVLVYAGSVVVLLARVPAERLGWFMTYWERYEGLGGKVLRDPSAFLALYVLFPLVLFGPATVLMGLAFAALQRAVQDDPRTSGWKVGVLQASNIVGCVLGSLVVGLFTLSKIGSTGTLRALVLTGLLFCVAGLRASAGKARAPFAALAGVLLLLAVALPPQDRLWARLHGLPRAETAFVDEDATSVVVLSEEGTGRFRMSTNGHGISWLPFGGVHTWLGALPAMIHPSPSDIAIIGLGSGDTAWGSACRPETERVSVFEICSPQERLLRRVAAATPGQPGLGTLRGLLADPRVSVELADGRHALLRTGRRYDVIELDALRPQSAYAGNLYSLEFYRLCAERLRPGGLMCTWAPTWRIHRTFRRVFPHVVELAGGQILVGGLDPIPSDVATWEARAKASAAYLGDDQARALAEHLRGARTDVRPVESDAGLNRDLFPRDELLSPSWRVLVPRWLLGGSDALYIPAAAHASGTGGAMWRTDLTVGNQGTSPIAYEITLLSRGQDNIEAPRRRFNLGPRETARHEDALGSVFGFTGGAALRITTEGGGSVTATSRTYNSASGDTLGMEVPALPEAGATAWRQEVRLEGLAHDPTLTSGVRTNLGLLNVGPDSIEVDARFLNRNGELLGERPFGMLPYEFVQIDRVLEQVAKEPLTGVTLTLRSPDLSARYFAFAIVIDNKTGAPSFVMSSRVR